MSVDVRKILAPAGRPPESPALEEAESKLNISVIFTKVEATLAALKHAGALASSLGARISLVVTQVVPYPLPLSSPPVAPDFNDRRFRVIAGQTKVETQVSIYLCRNPLEALRNVLQPHSLVVIGGRKTWWPTPEKRLAAQLRRAGHEVIYSNLGAR